MAQAVERRMHRRFTHLVRKAIRRIPGLSTGGSRPLPPGDLRSLTPISRNWGFDRGTPVDRYYIETFLAEHRPYIYGRVLEVEHDTYTRRFGSGVTCADVLFVTADGPRAKRANIIDDLTVGRTIDSNTYDCIILTQTLHVIYDIQNVVHTLYRILKPGGTVLVTAPGITQRAHEDWGDYWRFTAQCLSRLFVQRFLPTHVKAKTYGNVLTATAFLYGMAAEELSAEELNYHDPDYEVSLGLLVQKEEIVR